MAFQSQRDLPVFAEGQPFETLLHHALTGPGEERRYAVPSAGALYPYSFDITVVTAGTVVRHRNLRLAEVGALAKAGAWRDVSRLKIAVAFQPALSMVKYGNRGLTYGMQDCGHVLANLLLAAAPLGLRAEARLHPTTWAMECALPDAAPVFEIGFSLSGAPELSRPALAVLPDLLSAMERRVSASAFGIAPCPPQSVAAVLVRARRMADLAGLDMGGFGYHLGLRTAGNRWAIHTADHLAGLGFDPDADADAELDIKQLFCLQEFVVNASALVFLSAPLARPDTILRQSLAAGFSGQCLYLAAETEGLGVCCVGGFDYDDAARIFDLGEGRYAAYALVIGQKAAAQRKVDRRRDPDPREAVVVFPATRTATGGSGGCDAQA